MVDYLWYTLYDNSESKISFLRIISSVILKFERNGERDHTDTDSPAAQEVTHVRQHTISCHNICQ